MPFLLAGSVIFVLAGAVVVMVAKNLIDRIRETNPSPSVAPTSAPTSAPTTPTIRVVTTTTTTAPPPPPSPSPSPSRPPTTTTLAAIQPTTTTIAPGRLQMVVKPWAEVFIEEKSVGTTPLAALSLSPGSYAVRLQHPEFQPLRRRISIESGKTTRLDVDMRLDAVPLARGKQ